MLGLALPQGVQTVQPVLRAGRGVPGGAALQKPDDFVNRGLLVLVGPPVLEGENAMFIFSILCGVSQDSSAHLGQEPETPFLHPSSPGSPFSPWKQQNCPASLGCSKGKQERKINPGELSNLSASLLPEDGCPPSSDLSVTQRRASTTRAAGMMWEPLLPAHSVAPGVTQCPFDPFCLPHLCVPMPSGSLLLLIQVAVPRYHGTPWHTWLFLT